MRGSKAACPVIALLLAFSAVATAQIVEIIDVMGDGVGNALTFPNGIAVDGAGNAYVIGHWSHNAFKIAPAGVVTEIIDTTGDRLGSGLIGPDGIAVDGAGNVYLIGDGSFNAFKDYPGRGRRGNHRRLWRWSGQHAWGNSFPRRSCSGSILP